MRNHRPIQSIGWLIVFALLIANPGCRSYQLEKRKASLLAADRTRMEALISADEGELYMVLHYGLTYIHSNGNADTKDSLLEAVATGRIDYRTIEVGDRVVGFYGRLGIVSGPVHMVVATGEEELDLNSIYSAVYWWEGNRWQLGTYKSRPIPDTPPAR